MRFALLLLSLLLAFLTGWLSHSLYLANTAPTIEERAVVVEEQIRKIAKLATVEQNYHEFFNHKEIGYIDLPIFNKSVMVRARARVVMGFDLEGIQVEVDETTKRVLIRNWPAPSEIAFEVNSEYFDFDQGFFNGFETKELNAVSDKLKQTLRNKVDYSALSVACYEQAQELLDVIDANLELSGWRIEVEDWPATAQTPLID